MTWGLKIGVVCACLLFIYIQARYQAKRFKQQKTIEHWGKAAIYGLFVALLTACMMFGHWHDLTAFHVRLWGIPVIATAERMALFDPILNRCRIPPTPIWYNGRQHDDTGHYQGSWLDQLENSLSIRWVKSLKIGYIILFITVLIVL